MAPTGPSSSMVPCYTFQSQIILSDIRIARGQPPISAMNPNRQQHPPRIPLPKQPGSRFAITSRNSISLGHPIPPCLLRARKLQGPEAVVAPSLFGPTQIPKKIKLHISSGSHIEKIKVALKAKPNSWWKGVLIARVDEENSSNDPESEDCVEADSNAGANPSSGTTHLESGVRKSESEAGLRRPTWNPGRRAAMLGSLGSAIWADLGCRCCAEAAAAGAVQDWDYGGPCGPVKWQGLCTSGPRQSPINISSGRVEGGEGMGVLEFVYAPGTPSIYNTGHGTMQVSFSNANNVLRVGGNTLQLLQFHFHAPSEHAVDGERYAMEAHLVHRDVVTKKLAVVGILLDASKYAVQNECLEASLAYAPQEHGQSVEVPIQLSPSLLIPSGSEKNGVRGYVHYGGSLTTPPCSEGVEWFVLDTPMEISSSQVLDFMRFVGDGHSLAFNSASQRLGSLCPANCPTQKHQRPLQPLGDRIVFKGP